MHGTVNVKTGNLNLLEPLGPVQACNGIAFTLVFTFDMCSISLVRFLYFFGILSASCLITFLSPEIAASINIHVTDCDIRFIVRDGSVGLQ